ncbi:MAG: hypothetical protein D6806_15030 [Deltaproteobacteria bacterium]|nr:MAG: hypothetical protein D6806_15030 [Deltaproteobacteria bacterium]
MKKTVKRLMGLLLLGVTLLAACSYGGVAVVGDKAVVTRNDAFLFGALRKVYVCKVTDEGLTNCQNAEAP